MSNQVAIRDAGQHYAAAALGERQRYAMAIATAQRLLPPSLRGQDVQDTAARFMLLAEHGAMLGIHPLAAVNGIHIIDGKPTLSPGLMSGVVRAAGHKLRVRVTGEGEGMRAVATLIRSDDPDFPFESVWTLERATQAGLAGKDVWKKYLAAMLKARAISEVCREGAEDVLMGMRYTPEELDAVVNEDGEVVVDGPPAPPASSPRPQEVVEDASVVEDEPAAEVASESAWSRERIDEFLRAVAAETDLSSLRGMYDEAFEAGMLGTEVDTLGTTIEFLVMERKSGIENGVAPEVGAAEPESASVALDVEGGES